MKKIILGLILIVSITFGQESKGILYKATKGDKTVYLFGIVNISENDFLPFSDNVENAFKESQVLIIMNDLFSGSEDKDIIRNTVMKGMYFEGSLDKDISKETMELIENRYKELGMYGTNLNQHKLWLHYLNISLIQDRKVYNGNSFGIEIYFLNRFDKENTYGIIKYDDVITELMKMTESDIKDELKYSLEEIRKNSVTEILAWKNGDEKVLKDNLENYYTKSAKSFDEKVNERVVDYLGAKELKNKIFMLLPVNQLIGNNVLFEKLIFEGYKIDRVN